MGGYPLSFANCHTVNHLGLLSHRLHGRHVGVGANLAQVRVDVVHRCAEHLQLLVDPVLHQDRIGSRVEHRLRDTVFKHEAQHSVSEFFVAAPLDLRELLEDSQLLQSRVYKK